MADVRLPERTRNFFFSTASRPSLETTHPRLLSNGYRGFFLPRVKAAEA
jgi:hypothetical protein